MSCPLRRLWQPCLLALAIQLAAVPAYSQSSARSARPAGGRAGLRHALLAAEDARAPRDEDLAPLRQTLHHPSPTLQRIAVRALGRLERPALVAEIAPAVRAADPLVRAEAANALAQSLMTLTAPGRSGDLASKVASMLTCQLDTEKNPAAAESMLQALGRLPLESTADIGTVERRLTSTLSPASRSPAMVRYGAARGFEALSRLRRRSTPLPADAVAALKDAVLESPRALTATGIQVRRLALAALTNAKAIDRATIEAALADPDDQVRRLAAVAASATESLDGRADLVRIALRDRAPMVRYDALRAWGRRLQASDCGPIRAAVGDTNPHVALAALDLLGEPCPDAQASIELLSASVSSHPWHRAAHGYVSLARVSKERAEPLLVGFASNPTWQVRMYAARAAGFLGSIPTLERLASDDNDNVREAAVAALQKVSAHGADDIYIDALTRSDYQLIQTAADALEGSPKRQEAVAALLASLNRLTAEHRDTSRDPRMAILRRVRELGSVDDTPALEGCVADVDPKVAAECRSILTGWNGRSYTATMAPVRPAAVPSDAELARLGASRVRITMGRIGTFELQLFADEAPMTVGRFVRLVRSGYYNGLTFHRVVPNFVIQGGSPGANEFMGDGDYLRDEVGTRSHTRGTLGISTRGRDSGDAQIFVNLADNPRLDHIFTVFAEVIQGMDVVDRILEGDIIDRIEMAGAGRPKPQPKHQAPGTKHHQ